jgi:hypothetical protein
MVVHLFNEIRENNWREERKRYGEVNFLLKIQIPVTGNYRTKNTLTKSFIFATVILYIIPFFHPTKSFKRLSYA